MEKIPPPAERRRSFEDLVKPCQSFEYNGITHYIISRIGPDPKSLKKKVKEAEYAGAILKALGWKNDGKVYYLVCIWDTEVEDAAYQLLTEDYFTQLVREVGMSEISLN
jgi:hypothetical protein